MRCKRTHRPRMGNFGSPAKYTLATRVDSGERNEASLVEIDLGFSMQVGWDPSYVITESISCFVGIRARQRDESLTTAAYESLEAVVIDTADGRECRRYYNCQRWPGTRG